MDVLQWVRVRARVSRLSAWWIPALFLPLLLAGSLAADEGAKADEKDALPGATPPEFPKEGESFLAPTDRSNLRDWVHVLRTQLERLNSPPPTMPQSTDLHDAWESILKPRIARMLSRLDSWQESGRWVAVENETTAMVLKPDQWRGFTNDMAQLATELRGAWEQYQRVDIERKVDQRDSPQLVPHPVPTYPVGTLYRNILYRQAATAGLPRWHGRSYWHLLGRFRYAWDWGWEQSSKWWRYWERRQADEQLVQALRSALSATRDTLAETLLGLQVFIAAVQNAEEERLASICVACHSEDRTLREMAETALRDMAIARQDGEKFQEDSYAKYGSLLRAWLRRHDAAVRVLEVTSERLEEEVPEPPAKPDGATPSAPR